MIRLFVLSVISILILSACGGSPTRNTRDSGTPTRGGGYYQDDGPGDRTVDPDQIADAQPRAEPLHKYANRPYSVMGRSYTPYTSPNTQYKVKGYASWYGKKFHGQKTASGEIYDMYAMTAAHPTLPIPSYVRVTNLDNRKSVVVRVNDRGPFHSERIIDLSYAAASKIGIIKAGKGYVEVESINPANYTSNESVNQTNVDNSEPPAVALNGAIYPEEKGEDKGLFLQLGAFSSKENAESFLLRIRAQANLASPTKIVIGNGLFRIYAGPYATRDQLAVAQDQMQRDLGIKTVSVIR